MTSLDRAIEQMALAPVVRIAEQLEMKFIALNDAFEQITFHAKPSQKVLRRHFYGDPDTVFVVMDNARNELGSIYYCLGVGPAPVTRMFSERERLIGLVARLVNCWVKVHMTLRDYVYPVDLLPVEKLLGEAVRLQLELEFKLSEITP